MAKIQLRIRGTPAFAPSQFRTDTKKKPEALTPPESSPITVEVSSAEHKEYADWWVVIGSYLIVGIGSWIGTALASTAQPVEFTAPENTIGFLALLFVTAQAIERLMEPMAELNLRIIGSARKSKENDRDRNMKKAEEGGEQQSVLGQTAANEAADIKHIQANTKVFIWSLASLVAMIVCGATKIYFLEAIGVKGVTDFLNVLITGLVIGAGTKPLHELIKLIEKPSDTSNKDSGEASAQT